MDVRGGKKEETKKYIWRDGGVEDLKTMRVKYGNSVYESEKLENCRELSNEPLHTNMQFGFEARKKLNERNSNSVRKS